MKFFKKLSTIILMAFLLILLIACGNPVEQTRVSLTDTPLIPVTPSKTPFPTLTRHPTFTVAPTIPTATMNIAQETWLSTAVAVQKTQNFITQQAIEIQATIISEFPHINCDESGSYYSVSPNIEWIALRCGYEQNQSLVVENKEGIEWVLDFKDFIHPNLIVDGFSPRGGFGIIFWDIESDYLYFTTSIGWSGGGGLCFRGFGTNGLFRLNLKTGSSVTLIPPPEYFPGNEFKFSPTGRRYAADIDGVMITDIKTGEVIHIKTSGVMQLSWSLDGINLAYSIASCNEEGNVISSSVYIWNALNNEVKEVFKTENEEIILRPEAWDDNSTLRIIGEKLIDRNFLYTVYLYNITQEIVVLTGTATPQPRP